MVAANKIAVGLRGHTDVEFLSISPSRLLLKKDRRVYYGRHGKLGAVQKIIQLIQREQIKCTPIPHIKDLFPDEP